jgi:hypothetical protein
MSEVYHAVQLSLFPSIAHVTLNCACSGKRCSRCTRVCCIGCFHARSNGGYRSECKRCRKAERETDEFKANRRERRRENADHINEMQRTWYHAHPGIGPQAMKDYRKRNPEKVAADSREYGPIRDATRRSRKKQAGGHYTKQQWRDLKASYNYTCLCCGKCEPEIKLTPDHVIPVALLGSNDIDNIQPLCLSCNRSKSVKVIDYRPHERNAM